MTNNTTIFKPNPEITKTDCTKPVKQSISRAEKVWNAVKANPDRNAFELTDILGNTPYGSVSSMLSQLDRRGMVFVSGRRNHSRTYSTNMDEFELLDYMAYMHEETDMTTQMTLQESAPVPTHEINFQTEMPKPQIIESKTSKINLDELTIGEAKQLYAKLKEMFA